MPIYYGLTTFFFLMTVIHKKDSGKVTAAIITWEGSDPSLPSVMLNSHIDVVPVFPVSLLSSISTKEKSKTKLFLKLKSKHCCKILVRSLLRTNFLWGFFTTAVTYMWLVSVVGLSEVWLRCLKSLSGRNCHKTAH